MGEYRLKRARGRADINCSDSTFTEDCKQLHIWSTTSTLDNTYVGEKFDDSAWQTLKCNVPAYMDGPGRQRMVLRDAVVGTQEQRPR